MLLSPVYYNLFLIVLPLDINPPTILRSYHCVWIFSLVQIREPRISDPPFTKSQTPIPDLHSNFFHTFHTFDTSDTFSNPTHPTAKACYPYLMRPILIIFISLTG